MIIITGDSWGCGEWSNGRLLQHRGVGQYLKEHGHDVINLSEGGSSNFASYSRLLRFFDSGISEYLPKITHVLFFQTEWIRDYRLRSDVHTINLDQSQWNLPVFDQNLKSETISKFQYRLSELAQKYDFQVGLIGGCADTIWLDKFEQEYPGLKVLCQSMTNLCVNNDHRVDYPVSGITVKEFEYMKKNLKSIDSLSELVNNLEASIARSTVWKNNPYYFWPDGGHANRYGHKKLFDFIMATDFL
jgi:hypothetical protein